MTRFEKRLSGALLAFALVVTGCGPRGEAYASAPYVQDVRTTSAVIALAGRFDRLTVEVSPVGSAAPPRAVTEPGPVITHRVRLEGLEPETTYQYRVLGATGTLIQDSIFKTAPASRDRTITFTALGDSGDVTPEYPGVNLLDELVELGGASSRCGSATVNLLQHGRCPMQGRVVARMIADGWPDLVLHTGDVVYPEGDRGNYRRGFFEPFGPLIARVPIYAVVGNHDVQDQGGAPWDEAFATPANDPEKSPRYYSFDWGPVHFVALDVLSHDFGPGSLQRAFLEEDLARARATWRVVFFHVPPFSDGKHGDSGVLQQELVPVFVRHGVDLVLNGHEHNYMRFKPVDGVTYVVTGGGGSTELYDIFPGPRLAAGAKNYHYVRVQAGPDHLRLTAHDIVGNTFDGVELAPRPDRVP